MTKGVNKKIDESVLQWFGDVEKQYNRVNREVLWQVLRMYDVGGKSLSGIKSMYVDSSACKSKRG